MTNYLYFQIHGGASHGGFISLLSEFLASLDSFIGKTPPEMFATLFPGIASMDNIHPLLVHFPIAFLLGFFLLDFVGSYKNKLHWRYAASCMLYLGTVAAIFTVLAGLSAAESVEHGEDVHDIMEQHEHMGITVLTLAFFLCVWRIQGWGRNSIFLNRVFLGLSALLCIILSLGADLGGLMVYRYGVNVQSHQGRVGAEKGGVGSHSHGGEMGEDRHDHHRHGGHHSD